MIKNYWKVAIRYLLRNKGYSVINIAGLAIGITCCVLMMLFVRSEWGYDKFHSKADRIYRVWQEERYEGQDFINTVTPLSAASGDPGYLPGSGINLQGIRNESHYQGWTEFIYRCSKNGRLLIF